MTSTWNESLEKSLQKKYGEKKGTLLYKEYSRAFPHGYSDDYSPDIALQDIHYLEKIDPENPLEVSFYRPLEAHPEQLDLRLYQWQNPIPLSDILPMIENLDLRTINERPHKIVVGENQTLWISDFSCVYTKSKLDIEKSKKLLEDVLAKIYFGVTENDGFNKLILGCLLSGREVTVLRAYAKYLRQVAFRFSQTYIEKALLNNTEITQNLIALFIALNDPHAKVKLDPGEIEKRILKLLDQVKSLDEDRILRRLLDLVLATLRTNYFQQTEEGHFKDYLAFKLNSRTIPELPLPQPLYEIFVYSPRFEAIHLRNTKVARGGLRWSDRSEDFRTEVLGLMKAQTVKNAVIVPSGAKGGFVVKSDMQASSREAVQAEVIFCYKSFIRGLLDLTDNIVDNRFIPPKSVVCHDDSDPYLVVAADKGTSAFSDIANGISAEYDFWLGDAFASGGETGYDHKKIGITARGAWESVKRHFRELDIDVLNTNITVVGIGDMSGDVFGNGMLYTKHIKLIAAFDHRDIFVDPTPDPASSYQERLRLFNLPRSAWADYNAKLISKGGGVFSRTLKSIKITPEMKKALSTIEDELTPADLIKTILTAKVDLLYNGGIGTYVKSSAQSQADVSDRTNDYCRVNGNDLRCKVVCEGGNLGFTQLGRVEYALNGGLIYTDFIDNSAGVDCSDHEVNLKILLDTEVKKRKLTHKKRNQILVDMTQAVAELVLKDNYEQALVMSFSAIHSNDNINLHTNYLKELENLGILNRKVEYLPTDKELIDRKAARIGLTRPELAVLLAYTKIYLKHEILKTNLPEDSYLKQIVETAFPEEVRKKYRNNMQDHRLHRDIIATQLSNLLVNQMGITFVYRLQTEVGATIDEIIRSFVISSEVFNITRIKKMVESFDFKIPVQEQYDMLYQIRHLVNLAARWFLHTNHIKEDLGTVIQHFAVRVKDLQEITPELMSGFTKEYLAKLTKQFENLGIPRENAHQIATYRAIYTSLNIIEVATRNNFDLLRTAKVYFAGGERINLVWFRDLLGKDSREGHWNILSRLTLRDEFDIAQRALTIAIINNDPKEEDIVKLVEKWMHNNQRALHRWERILNMLHESSEIDYPMLFIAMRELIGLILSGRQKSVIVAK